VQNPDGQLTAQAHPTVESDPGKVPSSRDYFQRILDEASKADPDGFRRAVASLDGRDVFVTVETALEDESFSISSDAEQLSISTTEPEKEVAVSIRINPAVLHDILHGNLTPIEAFFMGKLRARGTTRALYAVQRFFISVAQIGSGAPAMLDVIEDFEVRKNNCAI
jgi:hypothetical protein